MRSTNDLFFVINDLNHSITDRMDPADIKKKLQLVIDDATQHFANEERLFEEWHYPGKEGHASKHAIALNLLQAIIKNFEPYGYDSG